MEELKYCPFCGSTEIADHYVYMTCKNCLARGPAMNGGDFDDHADYVDRQNAQKAWNKRASGQTFKVGEKVTYRSPGKVEKGIVKAISDDNYVFVVYHCGNCWDQYDKFTSARTANRDLEAGWND